MGFGSVLVLSFAFQAAIRGSPDSESGFVAGQVVDQVDQANRRRVAPPPNVAQVESFHGLTHEAKDGLDPRTNPGLLAVAFSPIRRLRAGGFLLVAQGTVAIGAFPPKAFGAVAAPASLRPPREAV